MYSIILFSLQHVRPAHTPHCSLRWHRPLAPPTTRTSQPPKHELQAIHAIRLHLDLVISRTKEICHQRVAFVAHMNAQLYVQREQTSGQGPDVSAALHTRVRQLEECVQFPFDVRRRGMMVVVLVMMWSTRRPMFCTMVTVWSTRRPMFYTMATMWSTGRLVFSTTNTMRSRQAECGRHHQPGYGWIRPREGPRVWRDPAADCKWAGRGSVYSGQIVRQTLSHGRSKGYKKEEDNMGYQHLEMGNHRLYVQEHAKLL